MSGVLEGMCSRHWCLIGQEGQGLLRLVQKHNVLAHLSSGLEAGLRRRQTDLGVELVMFAQGGRGGVEGVEWGGYGMGEGSSGGSYSDSREEYVMRASGGRVGSASLAAFIVVAFDGSGGGGGVGVGVTALRVSSVGELSGESAVEEEVVEVDHVSSRMPEWYGDGVSGNQDAEDVARAAGVLTCLRGGGYC